MLEGKMVTLTGPDGMFEVPYDNIEGWTLSTNRNFSFIIFKTPQALGDITKKTFLDFRSPPNLEMSFSK
jgi:hypothetical protein